MEITFVNVVLMVALVVVCVLLGFREGRRRGYAEGFADGMFAGEDGVMRRLPKSVIDKLEQKDRELKREMMRRIKNGESLEKISQYILENERIEL